MKRIFLSASIALSTLILTASCDSNDNETTIKSSDLPTSASAFITANFPNATYKSVEKQNKPDADGSIYDVYLTNGFEIDFDANGNWIDINGNNQEIPNGLIPAKIKTYLTTNYPNQYVTSIDNEKTYAEIELSNDIDLIFDIQGNFVRIDK